MIACCQTHSCLRPLVSACNLRRETECLPPRDAVDVTLELRSGDGADVPHKVGKFWLWTSNEQAKGFPGCIGSVYLTTSIGDPAPVDYTSTVFRIRFGRKETTNGETKVVWEPSFTDLQLSEPGDKEDYLRIGIPATISGQSAARAQSSTSAPVAPEASACSPLALLEASLDKYLTKSGCRFVVQVCGPAKARKST